MLPFVGLSYEGPVDPWKVFPWRELSTGLRAPTSESDQIMNMYKTFPAALAVVALSACLAYAADNHPVANVAQGIANENAILAVVVDHQHGSAWRGFGHRLALRLG